MVHTAHVKHVKTLSLIAMNYNLRKVLIFRFQDRVLKEKYMNLCTSLGPVIFADDLRTYQGYQIYREQNARFAQCLPFLGLAGLTLRIVLEN